MTRAPKLMLIAGHQRSGTTLLQILSNQHPRMVVTQEFGTFIHMNSGYRSYRRWVINRWRRTYDRAMLGGGGPRWTQILRNGWKTAAFLLRISLEYRHWSGLYSVQPALRWIHPRAQVIGDKYPDYIYSLDRLVRESDLNCVVIYRDPRDVVSSTLEQVRTAWNGREFTAKMDSAEKVARRWLRAIEIMQAHAPRLHIIRYEDLVSDPQPVLAAYAAFLGVEPEGFPGNWVRRDSVGKYARGLTRAQIDTVQRIAGEKMEQLGYSME